MQKSGGSYRESRAFTAALAAALWTMPALTATADTPPGSLQVTVDHLRPGVPLRVELYGDAASWTRQRGARAVREVRSPGLAATLSFDHLPPGRYAVRARQDPGGSGTMEPLLLSLPRHGDSGGGTAALPASFERAALRVGDGDPAVQLHLFTDSQY